MHGVDAHAALFWQRLAGWLDTYAHDYAQAWAEDTDDGTGDAAPSPLPDLAPAV